MPTYLFRCPSHSGRIERQLSVAECTIPQTCECGKLLERDLAAEWRTQTINTAGCQDHNFVPPEARVQPRHGHVTRKSAEKLERAYGRHTAEQRQAKRRGGGLEKTMSVPTELFHGKIKETGDKAYWDDPGNRSKHRDFEI